MMTRSIRFSIVTVLLGLSFSNVNAREIDGGLPTGARQFLETHCYDCHQGADSEGGLDIETLSTDLSNNASKWARIFDRVSSQEMPPEEADPIEDKQRTDFLSHAGDWIRTAQQASYAKRGRVHGRRLTNLQLERTLHDLLGIDIPLARRMPEEPRSAGFTTVAQGQAMSHFQLAQHVSVVDVALDEAFRRAHSKPDEWKQRLDAKSIVRTNNRRRTREPELIDQHAVTWAGRVTYYGRLPATTAREDGWYRFTIRAKALKPPANGGVWCTVRSGRCVSSAPLLTNIAEFEATPKSREWTYVTWLKQGDMLEVRPADTMLKMGRFAGGQIGTGEGGPQNVPGLAIEWIDVARVHRGANDEAIRQLLFGNLRPNTAVTGEPLKREMRKQLRAFAERAFRRPVPADIVKPFENFVVDAINSGDDLSAALRAGYRALLCSPRLLYFQEQPGKLDNYAIASRLSYFLWNRMPDKELFDLARASKLSDPTVIKTQVERMLRDAKGEAFVEDLAAQWLDLSLIDFTVPDRRRYPRFDVIVQESMLDETHAYLQKMLRENISVSCFVDSDFTFLNSRLARFYEIDNVVGDELQEVQLQPKHHRGGLLTQGAILKVTANGTTTSPVIRGVWVSERLLGQEIPPPPDNVPAIEPDIRGAKTIREMLAKHRQDASCASCHVKIDPPGFALENYDPSGRWRGRYTDARGRPSATIDASFNMPDGRPFRDLHEFKSLVVTDKEALARNVAEKLVTYGTGAAISFTDREEIESIVKATKNSDHGFRSLLHAVVINPLFLNK